jgi:LPS-assembly lipoprotein
MSWLETRAGRLALRFVGACALAMLTAGCFQPLYGDRAGPTGENVVAASLRSVEVVEVRAQRGTRLDRIGSEVRNGLIFSLTGGSGAKQMIVDIQSGRPDVQNYTLNADYRLVDKATGKQVASGIARADVSFAVPGLQQRFAGDRGQRDAETRAANVVAEQIRNRLASYFTAGT